jgi:hypothetical protein
MKVTQASNYAMGMQGDPYEPHCTTAGCVSMVAHYTIYKYNSFIDWSGNIICTQSILLYVYVYIYIYKLCTIIIQYNINATLGATFFPIVASEVSINCVKQRDKKQLPMLHYATMGQIPYVALTLPMLPNRNTPTNVALCNNGEASLCCTNFTNVAQQNHRKRWSQCCNTPEGLLPIAAQHWEKSCNNGYFRPVCSAVLKYSYLFSVNWNQGKVLYTLSTIATQASTLSHLISASSK